MVRPGNYQTWQLAPLSTSQVHSASNRWFHSTSLADTFVRLLEEKPYFDAAHTPLVLAHLSAIYERIGALPDRPTSVYRRIVHLLLEEWDSQRSIRRQSKYGGFDTDRKHELLSHLAFNLAIAGNGDIFSHKGLIEAFKAIAQSYDLPPWEAETVARELESHAGLFVESGYDQFSFSHKSIREYLAADHIVRLPTSRAYVSHAMQLPAELAIATSLSSRSSQFLSMLVFDVFSKIQLPVEFVEAFLARLRFEQPVFFASEDFYLAAFVLCCMASRNDLVDWLFDDGSRPAAWSAIAKHYRVTEISNERLALACHTRHSNANLPFALVTSVPLAISLAQLSVSDALYLPSESL